MTLQTWIAVGGLLFGTGIIVSVVKLAFAFGSFSERLDALEEAGASLKIAMTSLEDGIEAKMLHVAMTAARGEVDRRLHVHVEAKTKAHAAIHQKIDKTDARLTHLEGRCEGIHGSDSKVIHLHTQEGA
jgi:L-amino acid N-acyltransferase YncA